ncbi:MAG: hypothetical protein ACFE9O_12585 [Promethearchaeota archaeon]
MGDSSVRLQGSAKIANAIEPLGVIPVHFIRKTKVLREWREKFPKGRFILAEYNNSQFYRAYRLTSTIHQSGQQVITHLLFFSSYEQMIGYIAQNNLPTELYHTYSAIQLSTDRFEITGFKIRYNHTESAGYFTLPLQNGYILDTTLRIGDTVNITLFDTKTNTIQKITLHKILTKEHNYCAIRLTPTATEYFKSYYQIDDFPLLATNHIRMSIEKTSHLPVISQLRFRRVNLAKPSLLEEIFRSPFFFELFIQKYNLTKVVDTTICFGPDGRQRPDLIINTSSKRGIPTQIIGECKAVSQHYAQRSLNNALVQLLFYKTIPEYKSALRGFLIVTGAPVLPQWNEIKQIVQKYAKRNPDVKLYRYSRQVEAHIKERDILRDWCQNNLTLTTGYEIKALIQGISNQEQASQLLSLLNFIEK